MTVENFFLKILRLHKKNIANGYQIFWQVLAKQIYYSLTKRSATSMKYCIQKGNVFNKRQLIFNNEYMFVITETEATNCFSINFQVFTSNNNQHSLIKVHSKFITV